MKTRKKKILLLLSIIAFYSCEESIEKSCKLRFDSLSMSRRPIIDGFWGLRMKNLIGKCAYTEGICLKDVWSHRGEIEPIFFCQNHQISDHPEFSFL